MRRNRPPGRKHIRDPLLERLTAEEEPASKELRKDAPRSESPKVTAVAPPRSVMDMARHPRSWLRLLGPGLITGASDDDPSGIGTYSQVGSQFGYGLLWTALFTFPLMAAVQELCARIALQTGVGLGLSLRRKFPTSLVGVCVLALLLANTFNIGADLGAIGAGGE